MRALEGLKILDFSQVHGAAYSTMLLADMVAEVIKVEKVSGGDLIRGMAPKKDGYSLYHAYINRGKKSVSVDLKTAEGLEIVKKLIQEADCVVENFAYGTMERLGLGYEQMKEINPQIIYASLTGYGRYGEKKEKACFDNNSLAFSGMLDMTGYHDAEPVVLGMQLGNLYGGLHLALGIIYAAIAREKYGVGQKLEVSCSDSLFSALEDGMVDVEFNGHAHVRNGNTSQAIAPYDTFTTTDGYVSVGVSTPQQWEKFCKLLGMEELLDDPRYATNSLRGENYIEGGLKAAIEKITSVRSKFEIEELLGTEQIPCGSVCTAEEAISSEQLKERDMVIWVEDKVAGRTAMPGFVQKLTGTPSFTSSAPILGEDTTEILKGLGYPEETISQLEDKKVIRTGRCEK